MSTLRHVWQMLCQNKLFSAIYIFGTALALATVTVGAVIFNNKVAPIYPEYQRDRTAYISSVQMRSGNSTRQSQASYQFFRDYLSKLKNYTDATATYNPWGTSYAQPEDGSLSVRVMDKGIDPTFFRIYSLDFLAGAPFTQEDFDSGLRKIIITDRTARRIYGTDDYASLIGRPFSLQFSDYTVCGIVREGTPTEEKSFANVFYPYTTVPNYDHEDDDHQFNGSFTVIFLTDDLDALQAETADMVARYNNSQDEYELNLFGQPNGHFIVGLTGNSYGNSDVSEIFYGLGFVLLVLLLVPSLNLSGIISGQMEGRVAEMGVRKAFGAGRSRLLGSVLWENLVLTVIGGIAGFIVAYLAMKLGITDLLSKGDYYQASAVTEEMVFAPRIFIFTFLVCCVLNIMSALLPAYRSLRKPIVASLKA
ncbi:MAG: FtsX-like permease family protein [Bacteroidales bacterium]|nr:FtsX-like permease family protein [Bacteroidales bacterium]